MVSMANQRSDRSASLRARSVAKVLGVTLTELAASIGVTRSGLTGQKWRT
jgi:hypothetical protein